MALVQPQHLERLAIIYMRSSTLGHGVAKVSPLARKSLTMRPRKRTSQSGRSRRRRKMSAMVPI